MRIAHAKPGQPYGGKTPRPSSAMKRFLVHMQCAGGWCAGDPVRVARATVLAAERLGWAKVDRVDGHIDSAVITPLGIAAYTWGEAHIVPA